MIDTLPLIERPAHEIPAGNAVFLKTTAGDVLCLKVQRKAKNYVQDYVVRLDPAAEPEMDLEFVDPEEPLADCGVRIVFKPSVDGEDHELAGRHPEPGELVESEKGLFLAIRERTKLHEFVSFVNVESGLVRRLRVHSIGRIYGEWRFDVFGGAV
jgi:hypothetical protein